jgi:hypothetical protein
MSQAYTKPKEMITKSNQYQAQKDIPLQNPYRIRNSIQKRQEEPLVNKEITREIPVTSDINYCRFCGSNIDRDAVFCHMCGTKL